MIVRQKLFDGGCSGKQVAYITNVQQTNNGDENAEMGIFTNSKLPKLNAFNFVLLVRGLMVDGANL